MTPLQSTGVAYLLPIALLLALLAFVKKMVGGDVAGPKVEFFALIMGMAGLAALAMV